MVRVTLESEMRHEIERLESELSQIDAELQKLQLRVTNLVNIKKKKEHDLSVLSSNFGGAQDDREIQTDLNLLLRKA